MELSLLPQLRHLKSLVTTDVSELTISDSKESGNLQFMCEFRTSNPEKNQQIVLKLAGKDLERTQFVGTYAELLMRKFVLRPESIK